MLRAQIAVSREFRRVTPGLYLPNLGAAETIAYTLPRHAEWYLRTRDVDRIRRRFAAELTEARTLQPFALKPGEIQWWEGFIAADGEFAINAEKQGTPGILAFQEIIGDNTSLALEIRGPGVETRSSVSENTAEECPESSPLATWAGATAAGATARCSKSGRNRIRSRSQTPQKPEHCKAVLRLWAATAYWGVLRPTERSSR